jgi:ATP phosphoribosyltransferase
VKSLRIALPAGTLFDGACDLLRSAGVARLDAAAFDRALHLEDGANTFIKVRPTDIPVYVEMGAADCGIVGKDVLWESSRDCYELVDLRFGACRLVLAAPAGSPLARGHWTASVRVATKYPEAARRFFAGMAVNVELIRLHGSVELAPAAGLADGVVDITATGQTLRANRLVEIAEVDASTARLIVNQAALKTRSDAVNALAAALRRAADAVPGAEGAA